MSTYLAINFAIIFFPFACAIIFRKINFFSYKLVAYFISAILVGFVFIVWDVIATYRGDWSFNPTELMGIYLMGLPIEELLFFFTVPFGCLLLWEALETYYPDLKKLKKNYSKIILNIFSILLILAGIIFFEQLYTMTVLIFSGISLLIFNNYFQKTLFTKQYLVYLFLTLILFLVFNYLLTSIPVVLYNPNAIWGIRIATIPLEDFFYNWSLLTWYVVVYEIAKSKVRLLRLYF